MPATTTPFTRGTHWKPKRGKLYRFNQRGVTVIRPWPKPQAWCKQVNSVWHPAMPMIDLSTYSTAERMAWSEIPDDVRTAVLEAHFAGFQWNSLAMIARCPGGLELAQRAPMIASMLALGNRFRPQPVSWLWRSVRALLRTPDGWKRWAKICGWLGLDDSRAYVRMTRRAKIPALDHRPWSRQDWVRINQMWAIPAGRKFLLHTPVIAHELSELIGLLAELGGLEWAISRIHPNLAAELAGDGRHFEVFFMASELVQLWPQVWPNQPMPRLESVLFMEILRGELLIEHQHQQLGLVNPRGSTTIEVPEFPEPPLPGNAHIQPIDSEASLVKEGQQMNHCIGLNTWSKQARFRMGFGYHVCVEGEHASFWLTRSADSPLGFSLQQLQGPGNTTPSRRLVREVAAWFQLHSAWAAHRTDGEPRPAGEPPSPVSKEWKAAVPAAVSLPLFHDEIPF